MRRGSHPTSSSRLRLLLVARRSPPGFQLLLEPRCRANPGARVDGQNVVPLPVSTHKDRRAAPFDSIIQFLARAAAVRVHVSAARDAPALADRYDRCLTGIGHHSEMIHTPG